MVVGVALVIVALAYALLGFRELESVGPRAWRPFLSAHGWTRL